MHCILQGFSLGGEIVLWLAAQMLEPERSYAIIESDERSGRVEVEWDEVWERNKMELHASIEKGRLRQFAAVFALRRRQPEPTADMAAEVARPPSAAASRKDCEDDFRGKPREEMDTRGAGLPIKDQAPIEDQIPIGDQISNAGQIPIKDQVPVEVEIPIADQMPIEDQIAIGDQIPGEGQIAIEDQMAIEDQLQGYVRLTSSKRRRNRVKNQKRG